MKKNFFKKLSFVMALAMIVTALAPAAGVFAAAAPKLNGSKTVYLHVAENGTEFDFNVVNRKTGWKYTWKSSNADVAEVDSKGLTTAVGKGTAIISVVIKDKNGEKVDTLKANVVVRDNIKKLTITNAPADGKVAVGAKLDFKTSFVTASGNSKVTSGVVRYEVDQTGATIVAKGGLFTATEAGTYKVTANAFQSTAKYNSWLLDKTKYASYVTASATTTIKAAADTVKVTEKDLDTFVLTFDSAVTGLADKLSVYRLSGTTEILTAVKTVTMSSDNKTATVDMYSKFTEEATYRIKVTDMTAREFVACTSNYADVAKVEVLTTAVEVNDPKALDVALYNKDGVNIADAELKANVTYESSATAAYLDRSTYKLTMFNIGDTTTITATFHTYQYEAGVGEKGAITVTQVVSCVKELLGTVGNITAYTIANVGSPDWNNVNKTLAVGDTKQLFVKAKVDADDDNDLDDDVTSPTASNGKTWEFSSSNTNVLNINGTTGDLYPATAGTAIVMVKFGGDEVGTVQLTVSPKREVASITVDVNSFDLSNDTDVLDTRDITVTVKDQLGAKMSTGFNIDVVRSNVDAHTNVQMTRGAVGESTPVTFTSVYNAAGLTQATLGTHAYIIKAIDASSNKTISTYVSVNVKEPSSQTVARYGLEPNKTSYDTKLTSTDNNENVRIDLFGYAGNGVKCSRVDLGDGIYTVKYNTPNASNLVLTATAANTYSTLALIGGATPYTKMDKGTYTLNAYDAAGAPIASQYFTVVDTQATPVLSVSSLQTTLSVSNNTDYAGILAAIKDCFDIKILGNDVESTIVAAAANGTSKTGISFSGYGKDWFVSYVYVNETLDGSNYFTHKVEINKTIKTQQ